MAYLPILLTSPGKVVADTKEYLYLDPGRLLERAPYMWTPNIALGTVTHQQIGYLFPTGPYYWIMHMLGVPAWVSQRLWFGTILIVAALGVLYLMRTLHVRGPGVPLAAVDVHARARTRSNFVSRISVLLLPMCGLPWMLAFAIRAARSRRPRVAISRALRARGAVVGSINLTALVFVGIAPVLWIVYAVVGDTRDRLATRAAHGDQDRLPLAPRSRGGGSPACSWRAGTRSTCCATPRR